MVIFARIAWSLACARIQPFLEFKFPQLRHFKKFKLPLKEWLATLPEDARFIQIGSNDGLSGDPLHEFIAKRRWTGALVEPVPFLFKKLQQNYSAEAARLQFVNAAISSVRGRMDLFYVSEESRSVLDLPFWHDQLGSFDRGHIIRHLGKEIEPFIRSQPVDSILFQDLLDRVGVADFDLLHVDVEGHDYEVIRQVDLTRHNPAMVLFEIKHLAPAERDAAIVNFVRHGYRMFFYGADALAIRKDVVVG